MTKCPICKTFHGKYITAGSDRYWGECDSCVQYIKEYYNNYKIILLSEEDALRSELESGGRTPTHSPLEIKGGGGKPPDNILTPLVMESGPLEPAAVSQSVPPQQSASSSERGEPAPGEERLATGTSTSPGNPCQHLGEGTITLLDKEHAPDMNAGFYCRACGERVG